MALLTYEGFVLYDKPDGGYRSEINGHVILFDTVSQWKQYIDYMKTRP